jgi:hypothetical protein
MDLSPTLLEILDQERPPTFKGRSRWQEMRAGSLENRAVITECIADCNNPLALQDRLKPRLLAVRNSSHKLVINFKENTEHLFELATDPGEKRPLGENCCRAQRAALLQVAREHLKRVRNEVDQDLRLRSRIRELRVVHQIHSSCPTRVLHETAVAL